MTLATSTDSSSSEEDARLEMQLQQASNLINLAPTGS